MSEGARSRERVALFVPDLTGGGAERSMVTLAQLLAGRGRPVDLVLARARGPYLEEVSDDVRVVDLNAPGVLAALPRLVRYLRQARPAAAISTLRYANIALVWARALARVDTKVFLRESTTPSLVQSRALELRGRALPLLMRAFYPRADGVIAVSDGVARDLHASVGVPEHKIRVIHNPVVGDDLELRARAPLDDPWFAPDGAPVVLSVGRLSREKDFPTLIRAFGKVRHEVPARLMILGEGPARRELEQLVRALDLERDTRMPGFVPDPFPYMARAAVYVLSSKREGLPGALIQAMACGCPVVSTDCPSGPREVLADGRYGPLVPVGDVDGMAAMILRAFGGTAERSAALERSRDFSAERSVDGYLELLAG